MIFTPRFSPLQPNVDTNTNRNIFMLKNKQTKIKHGNVQTAVMQTSLLQSELSFERDFFFILVVITREKSLIIQIYACKKIYFLLK